MSSSSGFTEEPLPQRIRTPSPGLHAYLGTHTAQRRKLYRKKIMFTPCHYYSLQPHYSAYLSPFLILFVLFRKPNKRGSLNLTLVIYLESQTFRHFIKMKIIRFLCQCQQQIQHLLNCMSLMFSKQMPGLGRVEGPGVQSISCSCRGPRFGSLHPCGTVHNCGVAHNHQDSSSRGSLIPMSIPYMDADTHN